MSADVERVARQVCAILHGVADSYDVWGAIGEADRAKCRQIAAAAMAETRLIDAEALDSNPRTWHRTEIVSWLTARAKEVQDAVES